MAPRYPFIAFCSSVLNFKSTRKAFQDPIKQKVLFSRYQLTPAQKKAATSLDIDPITVEFQKELKKAIKEAAGPKNTAFFW